MTDTDTDAVSGIRYEERVARTGHLQIEPVLPGEDGGTGDRWSACWAPALNALPDHDSSALTLTDALVGLVHGLGEEVLDLRRKLYATRLR